MCFKNKLHAKSPFMTDCRVILRDIFKCSVDIERLPEHLISKAHRDGTVRVQTRDVTSNQHDHNYSKTSFNSSFMFDLNTENANAVVHTNHFAAFDQSSDSDFSFGDDDDDSEYDENDDDVFDANYSINHNEVDSGEENNLATVNDVNYVKTNGDTVNYSNGKSASDSGVCDEFTPKNMDAREINRLSAASDDDDEELQFLYGIKEMLDQSGDATTCSANRRENGEIWPENRIFGVICAKYLHSTCYSTYCEFPHQLPTKEYVENQLQLATADEIETVQNKILLRHDNLLTEFSAVFCTFYGRQWQTHRESLRLLISILSEKPMASNLMKDILNGFLMSGMKYSTCVNQLLIEINDSLNVEEKFEIMWQLIIDPKNDQADHHLKEFEEIFNSDSLVAAKAINKMIELQINDELESLRDTVIKFVKKSYVAIFHKIDSKLLETYTRHVGRFDAAAAKAIEQKAKQFGIVLEN